MGSAKCWQHYVIYISKNKLTPHTFRTYRQRSMKRCSCKWNIERQAIVHLCLQHLSKEKQVAIQQRLLFLSFLMQSQFNLEVSHKPLLKKIVRNYIHECGDFKKKKGLVSSWSIPKKEGYTYPLSQTPSSHFSLCVCVPRVHA